MSTSSTSASAARWRNWGRCVSAEVAEAARPRSVAEVADVVRAASERGLRVKAVGAGHSFTPVAVTDGVMLDLDALSGVTGVEPVTGRVRLGAGTRLWQLPALLGPLGLALENMGDIDRQSIAGAISTGTHGTGARFRGLSAQVAGARLVTADGELLDVDADHHPELLPAVQLGLGALGVLVEVTLQCVPAFLLRAHESSARLEDVLDGAADPGGFFDSGDHVEAYWWPGTDTVATKRNTRLPLDTPHRPPGRLSRLVDERLVQNGALRAVCAAGTLAPALTPPLNRLATRVLGQKTYTDHAHAVFTSPRTVRFREGEYAVPRAALPDAVRALRDLVERRRWRISFPVELRVAAADGVWLSTAYERDAGYVAVHRYWREDPEPYIGEVDALMRDFEARPHWGKLHHQDAASLAEVVPRLGDFSAVRDRLDPDRVFGNDYLGMVLGD
ncbi:FAD-linked oxidoreductase [Marmoricola endophyticus]|uniref:FAD-linked oxidoreductase n=1 Tax=Marmoricola endophyticus TaxID=2040280 RepID=A0A917F116_9ACTN|nr:D-arabinono-1,4-lactone oxidase [Marmoricola endophyticus]GGF37736.1 FAD-linked oxidoreductase [Marmoricola endophyticus]